MSKKFPQLVAETFRAGTENLPGLIGVSSHRVTKTLNSGQYKEMTAEELIRWSELLGISAVTLIKEYGCGYESLTPKDLNEVYNYFGYTFELPEPLMSAA